MCLNKIYSVEAKEEWMEDKPDNITAYKVVKVIEGTVHPPIYPEHGPYAKTNDMENILKHHSFWMHCDEGEAAVIKADNDVFYEPLYHLFLTREGAEDWRREFNLSVVVLVLECSIPKSAITNIGIQEDHEAVIAREFTFVGGQEYFE